MLHSCAIVIVAVYVGVLIIIILGVAENEDLHFCSATYRLIKITSSELMPAQNKTKTDENLVPIQYKGW